MYVLEACTVHSFEYEDFCSGAQTLPPCPGPCALRDLHRESGEDAADKHGVREWREVVPPR
jgi:hypothetical protein